MRRDRTRGAWRSLETLWDAGALGARSDVELLDVFRSDPGPIGQEAFRILVERHGAMVMGVCRGLVGDPHEAEDAFQATFLVLVRRAGSIRNRETIAPWLYAVACRVSRKARIRAARRRRREVSSDIDPPARPDRDAEASATDRVLQEEIRRLPESLRSPLVLCALEGQSYVEAARRLGLTEPALRGRLHRARKRLQDRLRDRGILAAVTARMAGPDRFPLPTLTSSMIESTTHLAMRWTTLGSLLVGAGTVPGPIAALARGVIHAMLFQTVKIGTLATILTAGAVATIVVAQSEKRTARTPEAGIIPPPPASQPARKTGERFDPRDLQKETRRILEILSTRVELDLPKHPPLSAFLKAIKKATTRGDYSGIRIYVDPIGLQEANVSMDEPVTIYKTGNLGFVLSQALRLSHLSYFVQDGFMQISSRAFVAERRLEVLDQKFDKLQETMERNEHALQTQSALILQHR